MRFPLEKEPLILPFLAPIEPPLTDFGRDNHQETDQRWSEAGRRADLYLEALGVPEKERPAIVDRTIERARSGPQPAEPLAAVMSALIELLAEAVPGQTRRIENPSPIAHVLIGQSPARPRLNRGFMIPEELDRTPWRTLYRRRIKSLLTGPFTSPPLKTEVTSPLGSKSKT
ncbi:MAG: hypothetical protein AB1641_30190 [Thermodesulfobacteriota bacterium]